MNVTKEQFEAMLKTHDWYYHLSDSMKVFDKGENMDKTLRYLAKGDEEFAQLYLEYKNKAGV